MLYRYNARNIGAHVTFLKQIIGTFIGASAAICLFSYLGFLTDTKASVAQEAVVTSACPDGTRFLSTLNGKKVCELKGVYTRDLKLSADKYWALNGEVVMGGDNSNNITLDIEPGTTIYGSHGPDFLLISRGSKIHANGNKLQPIIFTSAQDVVGRATKDDRGQWGGLVIAGNAPTNAGKEEAFEFSKTGRKFGGSQSDDDSGILKYLLVKYAGYEVSLDKELNGISLGGVGSGTVIDYVEVYNNADDGIELWGGTVNLKHILLVGNGDDGFDVDHGYNGKVQYLYIKQTDVISYDPRGIEADNHKSRFEARPLSFPKIANFEIHGNSLGETGVMLRRGSGIEMVNGVIDGFGKYGVAFRNRVTLKHKPRFHALYVKACRKGPFGGKYHLKDKDTQHWIMHENDNNSVDTMPTAVNVREYMNDNFFEDAPFIGAFTPESNWSKGWSIGL